MKKKTPGKWLGLVAFFYIMICLTFSFVITIINTEVNIEYLYKIDLIAFGVFSIVWGAVFGSGMMKKHKGINESEDNND